MLTYLRTKAQSMILNLGIELRRSARPSAIFFSDTPPLPDMSLTVAEEILLFLNAVDPFYAHQELPAPLKIGGAWLEDLKMRRLPQIQTYESGEADLVASLHESMFFNCLTTGLWNYGYLQEGRVARSALAACSRDFVHTRRIWPEIAQIRVLSPVPWWGVQPDSGVAPIRFTDTWHWTQERHIANAIALRTSKAFGASGLLEIGSGFGGLAERLARRGDIDPIVLVDIPLNLVTAFYYLRRSFPDTPVTLYSSVEQVTSAQSKRQTGIHLVPSSLFKALRKWQDLSVVANFGSFSEMDSETVAFYLSELPDSSEVLVQCNSNSAVSNTGGHREVPVDKFDYPSRAVRVFESPYGSLSSGDRYKTLVHVLKGE